MDIRKRAKISAWPLLGGLQVLILSGLIAAGISTLPPRQQPMAQRLSAMDLQQASTDVTAAIEDADSGRALQPDDEQRTTMFLQLLSQAAELELLSLDLSPGPRLDALQTVDATLSLVGDPFHLPIFLDGLQRQRTVNHVVSLEGRGGVSGHFTLQVRYYRPVEVELDWVAARLVAEDPSLAAAGPLMRQAAELSVWRRFQWEERGLVERAKRIRARVSRELAAPLIELRAGGSGLAWDAEQGVRMF